MSAIPTVYRGTQFRSRLEATWAAFFDRVGWAWEYEPFDLGGWIPDFALRFPEPVLVEVKPELTIDGLRQHTAKIDASGWKGAVLLVGASWDHRGEVHTQQFDHEPAMGLLKLGADSYSEWEPATAIGGRHHHFGFAQGGLGDWGCLYCGRETYGEMKPFGRWDCSAKKASAHEADWAAAWAEAKNQVQWRPPRRGAIQ